MRPLKSFSRKRPVTAQPSLAPTAANTVRRRITGTRARERARNSYIRNHELPPGGTHIAGYELIMTAPCPRTAVFRSRGDRLASPTDDGQPPRPAPITQTAKPVARSPTICGVTCLAGKGAGLVHVPGHRPRRADRAASTGRNQIGLDQVQPCEETAIPSELRRVYDVAASRFRGQAASVTRSPPVAGGGDNSSGRQPQRHETPDPVRALTQ